MDLTWPLDEQKLFHEQPLGLVHPPEPKTAQNFNHKAWDMYCFALIVVDLFSMVEIFFHCFSRASFPRVFHCFSTTFIFLRIADFHTLQSQIKSFGALRDHIYNLVWNDPDKRTGLKDIVEGEIFKNFVFWETFQSQALIDMWNGYKKKVAFPYF